MPKGKGFNAREGGANQGKKVDFAGNQGGFGCVGTFER